MPLKANWAIKNFGTQFHFKKFFKVVASLKNLCFYITDKLVRSQLLKDLAALSSPTEITSGTESREEEEEEEEEEELDVGGK